MQILFETERLYLRRVSVDDFETCFQLDSNPEVMRYIRSPFDRDEFMTFFDDRLKAYDTPLIGLGRWMAFEKITNDFVGIFMLKSLEDSPEVEVGYRMHQQYWGKGYATEITTALLSYGFDTVGLSLIVAIAQPANVGSWRVMEKCGLKRIGYAYHYNTHVVKYEIKKVPDNEGISVINGAFEITTDKARMNLATIYEYLHHHSYWAKGIPMEKVMISFNNSLTFGILHEGHQVGFARVITDYATFAYLADVFVLDTYRGKGLSKWLMETITQHPDLQELRRWTLATHDAHTLYARYGFEPLTNPERWMQKYQPYQ